MSTISDDLCALVRALAPAEKRYVRLLAGRTLPQGNRCLELFDAFQKDKGHQYVRGKTDNKKLSTEKNYLYRFLLKGLRAFHAERTIDIHLHELLINARLLIEKRLYDPASRELDRATKLALRHERFAVLTDVLLLQSEELTERNPEQPALAFSKINKLMQQALDQLHEQARLKLLQDETFVYLRARYLLREEIHRKRLEELGAAMQGALPATEQGFAGQQLVMNLRAMLAICSGDFSGGAEMYEEMLKRWDAEPGRTREDLPAYLKLLSNYLVACHGQHDFTKIPALLDRIRAIPCRSAEEEADRFQSIHFIELLFRLNTGRFDQYASYVQELERGLTCYRAKISEARWLAFHYNIAVGFFILQQWSDAQQWIANMINSPATRHRIDLQCAARIIRLVVYYELRKHDLLEYELINTERFLRQRKNWFAWEATVVKFLKKLLDGEQEKPEDLFTKFIGQQRVAANGRDSASLPGASEIQLWARWHAEGRSIRMLLMEEKVPERMLA